MKPPAPTLYFHPASGCSRRVLALLGYLDLPFEPALVDLARGEQRQAGYLALNPNAKVPTLVDGDLVLWESEAILRRLAREHRPSLLGDARSACEVDRWVAWGLTELSAALSRLNAETGLAAMAGKELDPEAIAAASARVAAKLDVLEPRLHGEWLAADSPTLAEFTLVPSLEASMTLARLELDRWPRVRAWVQRSRELAGWPAPIGAEP